MRARSGAYARLSCQVRSALVAPAVNGLSSAAWLRPGATKAPACKACHAVPKPGLGFYDPAGAVRVALLGGGGEGLRLPTGGVEPGRTSQAQEVAKQLRFFSDNGLVQETR